MGLLDDAIREHLELKRRSGADAREVDRLEHEAFGPIQREELRPSEAFTEEPPALADLEPEPAYEPEPPVYEAPPEPAHEPAPVAYEDDDPFADLAPTAPAPAEDPQATVAFSLPEVEEVERRTPPPAAPADPDAVGADEEHDELEETPDFLQETPEHDRLWFEQKPPRDFDF